MVKNKKKALRSLLDKYKVYLNTNVALKKLHMTGTKFRSLSMWYFSCINGMWESYKRKNKTVPKKKKKEASIFQLKMFLNYTVVLSYRTKNGFQRPILLWPNPEAFWRALVCCIRRKKQNKNSGLRQRSISERKKEY